MSYPVRDRSLLILGSGGAAKAVVFQSATEGVREIIIANRTVDKAIDLKRQTEAQFPSIKMEAISLGYVELKNAISRADIVVNTTSLGLRMEDPSPLPNGLLHKGLFICDLIYNPPETALIRDARESGCQYMNGIGMLLHQGAASFKIWTEVEPPLEVMRQAIETAIRSLNGYKQAR
jgi:shikimate dehydrogenase